MNSQKARSKSANKNRKEIIPSTPKANNQSQRQRDRIAFSLKEFKAKSSSSSAKKKKSKHERQLSLTPRSNTLNTDYDTGNDTSSIRTLISNAKNILGTQTALLSKCSEMTKLILNTDLELDSIYSQTEINNDQFIRTLNQFKTKLEVEVNEKNNKQIEDNDRFQLLVLNEMNSLNEMIGKMGYNYVFHKFKTHNFNSKNISEYFSNTKKLIIALNNKEQEANEKIQQQQYELNAQKEMIAALQHELMQVNALSTISNQSERIQIEDKDGFKDGDFTPTITPFMKNSNSNISNIVLSSNLFDSNSFFEGYKRNKELRNDLVLDHNYTEMNISQSTTKGNERNSMNEFDFRK